MTAPVDVKRPYARAEWRLLDLVSDMGGWRCRCLSLSKNHGGVHNGGNVGEWIGGVGGGLVATLM